MNKLTIFGIVTAFFVGLLPFVTSRHLIAGLVNAKYFLIVAVVLALASLAASLFVRGVHTVSIKNRPLLWAELGVLAVYWLAALLGVFPERSLFADIQRSSGVFFMTHIAVLAFLLGEFLTARDWSLARRTIVVSSAMFGFLTLLGVEGIGLTSRFLWINFAIPGLTLGNSTFAGTYLLLALIIALIEIAKTPQGSRWHKMLIGSSALIMLSPVLFNAGLLWGKTSLGAVLANPVLLLGSARASSAAALLLLIFLGGYVLLRKYAAGYKKYMVPAWAALFGIALIGGVALLFTPGSAVQEKYIETSSEARILVWEGGMAAFKERSLLGFGPENFERALQGHFDNNLFLKENFGEIWFDRAHNIVVDTLTTVGVVGALAYMVLIAAFVWVVYRARKQGVVGESEAIILYALPVAHVLQLQTGFDTVGSFVLLGVLGGYALWLERAVNSEVEKGKRVEVSAYGLYHKVGAGVLGVLVLVSGVMLLREFDRQSSLYRLFVTTNTEEQLRLAEAATSRPSSFESLRAASASLIKAVLGQVATGKASQRTIDNALSQMQVYEEKYRHYLELEPEHYRARLNFAYLLANEAVLNPRQASEKLSEAKSVVAGAYALSPNNLLTPALDALLELYSGNIAAAKQKAQELLVLNPNAELSKRVVEHIKKQEQKFPAIAVMRMEEI